MKHRSRYGAINRLSPEAAGRCDRGGEIRKRSELIAEMRWAGNRLVPTGFLCCAQHIDPPHPQDRIVVLRADPVVVRQPRPNIDVDAPGAQPLLYDRLVAENGSGLLTEEGDRIRVEDDPVVVVSLLLTTIDGRLLVAESGEVLATAGSEG